MSGVDTKTTRDMFQVRLRNRLIRVRIEIRIRFLRQHRERFLRRELLVILYARVPMPFKVTWTGPLVIRTSRGLQNVWISKKTCKWYVDQHERVSLSPLITGSELDVQEERLAHSVVEDIPEEEMAMDPIGGQFPSSSTSASSTLRLTSPPLPSDSNSETDRSQLWRFVLCLVTFLNLRFHLPQRACNLILNVL
jgi:hypothetical protein